MRFAIHPAAQNELGPKGMESLLRSMHTDAVRKHPIWLILRSNNGTVGLAVDLPDSISQSFVNGMQDAYPGTTFSLDTTETEKRHESRMSVRLAPDFLSLRTAADLRDVTTGEFTDPLNGLLSAIRCGRSGRIECEGIITLRPATESRVHESRRAENRSARRFIAESVREFYLINATHQKRWHRWLANLTLLASRQAVSPPLIPDKLDEIVFETWIDVRVSAPRDAITIVYRKLEEVMGALTPYSSPHAALIPSKPTQRKRPRRNRGFLLTPAELALLWHLPMEAAQSVSRLALSPFKEVEPPINLPAKERKSGVTSLGRVIFRRQRTQFGIEMDDLRRHLIAIGKTGCGKSTFLQNVVLQQIEAGRGVVLIDPHGQLVDDVIGHIPKRRTNDVILFDAGDREWTVPFNPLIGPPGADAGLVADGVLTAFQKVFGLDAGSAPRLLHIFRNCLLSLIGRPDASLMAIQRLLTDMNYRKTVTANVTNPVVREFWLGEFGRWNDRDRTQYIASLQNKLGAFTTNERLQRIFAPSKRGLNLRTVLNSSQILLCNLSKGTVGHDASTLLGSLLLSSLQTAAMSRADISEEERADAVIVIDEFHSYLSPGNATMADALAESRKYRTSYILATQLLEQLDNATLAGVMGNCGSVLTMTVGPRDATVLAELLGKGLSPEDLMQIPKYHGYVRMLNDGVPSTFSMTTLPPPRNAANRTEIIRRASRQRYGVRA